MPPPPSTPQPPALPAPDPALVGARIQGVQQPDDRTVVLETHRSSAGAARWVLSAHPETARLGRTFARAGRGGRPPVFCQWLRSRLVGGHITGVSLRHPQVLDLAITHGEAAWHLVLELNRRDSNMLLLDGEERLLIALRHPTLPGRHLSPGEAYRPPERLHAWPRTLPLAERYPAPDEGAARAREAAWQARAATLDLEARRGPARRQARRELKRLQRRAAKLEADRDAAGEAEQWRRRGELLQIHRSRLHAGMSEVQVPDVFAPGQPLVTIALDARADPGQNIERCFHTYRKRRDAAPHVEQRLAETRRAEADWRALLERLDAAEDPAALDALAESLPAAARSLRSVLHGDAPRAGPPAAAQGPLRRRSAEGYEILVGRSREENERVTFRLGRGRDWWLHAQGIPGSHVIVRNPGGDALPPRTLREAAWLAGYYSQARAAGRVEVDYTQRKHVRKQKGGEPGQVIYTQNRTLLVDLDDAELRRVLQRTDDEAG